MRGITLSGLIFLVTGLVMLVIWGTSLLDAFAVPPYFVIVGMFVGFGALLLIYRRLL